MFNLRVNNELGQGLSQHILVACYRTLRKNWLDSLGKLGTKSWEVERGKWLTNSAFFLRREKRGNCEITIFGEENGVVGTGKSNIYDFTWNWGITGVNLGNWNLKYWECP